MKHNIEQTILDYIEQNPNQSSKMIYDGLGLELSYATLKRRLNKLKADELIDINGSSRATVYCVSNTYLLFAHIDVEKYFENEIDERHIKESFNLNLIPNILNQVGLFSFDELNKLEKLQEQYQDNIAQLSSSQYYKELERLAIDLSWKSSQIEGNTYSLLETERLLKEKETAEGKAKDDAIMLLNHKQALDFIINEPNYINPISIARIEDIHSILIQELGVDRNLRKRRVGISGTNYRPLDNEFQIREALQQMCDLVNSKTNVFEKALLVLVLISYIQAFNDGNKRTARIISNALLISHNYCPISFRSVNSIDYKKAMLLFYEQNNLQAFKKIFIQQFEFAVRTYF
ncbi:MAG TPA: Fic family protein [Saprospiraceae bacterium]|nr:Fic family protein [Saprospiraceae bacterium]